mmetsp:Transcript_17191/g.29472  ORF Transcript_17191/g.29472 Transcript_17191/m.29472 type:complete len:219 (+) Transcript_17191:207-863(+)
MLAIKLCTLSVLLAVSCSFVQGSLPKEQFIRFNGFLRNRTKGVKNFTIVDLKVHDAEDCSPVVKRQETNKTDVATFEFSQFNETCTPSVAKQQAFLNRTRSAGGDHIDTLMHFNKDQDHSFVYFSVSATLRYLANGTYYEQPIYFAVARSNTCGQKSKAPISYYVGGVGCNERTRDVLECPLPGTKQKKGIRLVFGGYWKGPDFKTSHHGKWLFVQHM